MVKARKILDAGWHPILRDGERVTTHCVIYKEWDERGRVVKVTLGTPKRGSIERVSISLREYHRQVRKYNLLPRRKPLTEDERKARRLKSAERYREKLRHEWKGRTAFGYRLPDDVKRRIYSMIAEDIPNVEISKRLGVSPSQVSRMRRGQRCKADDEQKAHGTMIPWPALAPTVVHHVHIPQQPLIVCEVGG
jgi:hypothetical protein